MPYRTQHGCAWPGCLSLTREGRYCDSHKAQAKGPRLSPSKRGYDSTWQRIRRMVLARHPLCRDPFGVHGNEVVIATEVDHIIPIRLGGSNAEDNLQALCKSCHSRKTVIEGGMHEEKD